MSDDYKARQAALIAERVKEADFVITTALIPGRPAPKLVTDAMVASMKPGSVIVDMAAETGGNVEGTEAGKEVVKHGVTIIGLTNLPATMPGSATAMYAKNMQTLLKHLSRTAPSTSTSPMRSPAARPSPTAARSSTRRPPRRWGSRSPSRAGAAAPAGGAS